MTVSVNRVTLLGNLGNDPEIRRTQDGKPIATLSVATTESWRDRNTGEKRDKTEWHRVVIFNEGLAKVAESYLKKGSKIFVEGQLQTRKWTDQNNQDRYTTEVVLSGFNGKLVMLNGRSDSGGNSQPAADTSSYGDQVQNDTSSTPPVEQGEVQSNESVDEEYNDDIPF